MKKRTFDTDFTSLLDITIILLFFFIIYSRLDTNQSQSNAEQTMKEAQEVLSNAEQMMQDAEELHQTAEALQQEAEQQLAILEEANQDAAAMAEGINQYRTGENHISLLLLPHGKQLMLEIKKNDESLGIWETEHITKSLIFDEFVKAGYNRDSYIFCDLIYNSSDENTHSDVSTIREVLDDVRREFKYLYKSETDLDSE